MSTTRNDDHRYVCSHNYHVELGRILDWPRYMSDAYDHLAHRRAQGDATAAEWVAVGDAD